MIAYWYRVCYSLFSLLSDVTRTNAFLVSCSTIPDSPTSAAHRDSVTCSKDACRSAFISCLATSCMFASVTLLQSRHITVRLNILSSQPPYLTLPLGRAQHTVTLPYLHGRCRAALRPQYSQPHITTNVWQQIKA